MDDRAFAWKTPLFSDDDPLITRFMQLRPSLWVVVFAVLEDLAKDWQWFQDDPTHATVEEVIIELIKARTALEIGIAMYIGEIREFATADAPQGWLRCDGATYENTDYPLLAAAIHPGLVVDADHFRVPDRDRRLAMDGLYVGTQEGSETHTNTIEELVPHHHSYDQVAVTFIDPGVSPSVIGIDDINPASTSDTGDGEAYSILNPVEGSQFYIRAAWPTAGG